MRILLLGKNGQLGWEAHRALAPLGEIFAFDIPEIDFSKPQTLRYLVDEIKPQIIYNAAAYTAVDQAETQVDLCRLVNTETPAVLADAARKMNCLMIHFSTDYVFDGQKNSAYLEEDPTNPLNLYGQTKLEGEKAVLEGAPASLVLRTSWVYSLRGNSFVSKVQQWARQQPILKIVSDQVSGPTWARMLAQCSALLISQFLPDPIERVKQVRGIYHLAGDGFASRLEWAQEIIDLTTPENSRPQIIPAKTADFPTPATRPLVSVLNCDKFTRTFNLRLPPWKLALELALKDSAAG